MMRFKIDNENDLKKIDIQVIDSVLISLPIYKSDLINPSWNINLKQGEIWKTKVLLDLIYNKLSDKWILFIYWTPVQLINIYTQLNKEYIFKYWIWVDFWNQFEGTSIDKLKHNHMGVLMLTKWNSYIPLNTKELKIPYASCNACEKNIKDWWWKKHLMNKKWTWITDVWKDFFKVTWIIEDKYIPGVELRKIDISKSSLDLNNDFIPSLLLDRIEKLVSPYKLLTINLTSNYLSNLVEEEKLSKNINTLIPSNNSDVVNKIFLWDCIKVMEDLLEKYPNWIFDLSFADPPYNLSKNYIEYDDTKSEQDYIEWCNKWTYLMAKLTKKDWNIVILNMPKWSIYHALELNKHSYFHNWIIWDSLSVPNWKILPAHYSLLLYSNSNRLLKYNDLGLIDSSEYCLRSSCIKNRKKDWIDNKSPISDIWTDIHRIKHKRDRDDHPCQLPDKLMDRIINMFSNPGDLVFDPFCWAWTTAISSLRNNRKYCTIEIDNLYYEISQNKIKSILEKWFISKKSTKKRSKSKYTKKLLEQKLQDFTRSIKRKPTFEEFIKNYSLDIEDIKLLYPDTKELMKNYRYWLLD